MESVEYIKSAPDHPSWYSAYFQVSNGLKVFFKSVTSKNTPRSSSGTKIPATGAVFANSHKLAGPSHKLWQRASVGTTAVVFLPLYFRYGKNK